MLKRQIIQLAVAAAIVLFGLKTCGLLSGMREEPKKKPLTKQVRLIKALEARNDTLKKLIAVNGKLIAKEKIEVFSEVTGVLLPSEKAFKVGQEFNKGDIMLLIDGSESLLNLKAQRSAFINLINQTLPDINIDYNEGFEAWSDYINKLNPNKRLLELPEVSDPLLKNFLTGRNIYQQYYSIKSLEQRQDKFAITAPFKGSISSGILNAGTLIRAGQKIGEFIKEGEFELEAAIPANAGAIEKGSVLSLKTDNGRRIEGIVTRMASVVNPNTQRVGLYANVRGDGLKEGMYLEGTLQLSNALEAVELDRNLVIDDTQVYVVKDSILVKKTIDVVHEFEQKAYVTGLDDGDQVLNQIVEGAFEGMLVKIEE